MKKLHDRQQRLSFGASAIDAERQRQADAGLVLSKAIASKNFDIVKAAACYLLSMLSRHGEINHPIAFLLESLWPESLPVGDLCDGGRELEKSGALIALEIERRSVLDAEANTRDKRKKGRRA